jgi:hypothetical protein
MVLAVHTEDNDILKVLIPRVFGLLGGLFNTLLTVLTLEGGACASH